ncbi:hypothetical protein PENSPDRAFT_751930 [Peniophora sp. CONT]|nr:hypothetical protein PENSPDRAFT_751930 [Peniophora sp. CONT]
MRDTTVVLTENRPKLPRLPALTRAVVCVIWGRARVSESLRGLVQGSSTLPIRKGNGYAEARISESWQQLASSIPPFSFPSPRDTYPLLIRRPLLRFDMFLPELYRYLSRRFKRHRAQKAGIPYEDQDEIDLRLLSETKLPDGTLLADATPEEIDFSKRHGLGGGIDWKNWRKYFTMKYWTARKLISFLVTTTIITLLILVLSFQDSIVRWVEPIGKKWTRLPGGWLIPVAILIVQSFPPIIGQEVVHILAGVLYGIGPGFGIVAAGTILGEIAEFYAFRLICGSRTNTFERKNLSWGLFADIARDGGLIMVLMTRLSVLPSSYTTVVFALAGTNFFTFLSALVLSLVQPLANVYIGVLARESADGQSTSTSNLASGITIAGTISISIAAMLYINHKANKAKPGFITRRRVERLVSFSGSRTTSLTLSSTASDVEVPA